MYAHLLGIVVPNLLVLANWVLLSNALAEGIIEPFFEIPLLRTVVFLHSNTGTQRYLVWEGGRAHFQRDTSKIFP